MAGFDALVIADDPRARLRIAGLPAVERAIRVARRVGAGAVTVVDGEAARRALATAPLPARLLVIRADQLVHTPLVAPLVAAAPTELAIAVAPDGGAYAGAYLASGGAVGEAVRAIAAGPANSDGRDALGDGTAVPHGAIACHPIGTREERRAAHRLLYRILIKPQDNAITRYLYRPVSFPLTRLLAWTPITPNQISYLVGVMVLVGCWLTAHREWSYAIAGTATVLAASYLDCCDGEIARVKLLSSRFGAWIDTVIDEASSIGYMVALGLHCSQAFGRDYLGIARVVGVDPWLLAAGVTAGLYVWEMFVIYYNIIVAVGSANSQDYVGKFEVVPGDAPNTARLRPAAPKAIPTVDTMPRWLRFLATYAPYVMRRDFIAWGAMALALAHLTQVSFVLHVAGGVVAFPILTRDHLRLVRQRRSIVSSGRSIEAPG